MNMHHSIGFYSYVDCNGLNRNWNAMVDRIKWKKETTCVFNILISGLKCWKTFW